MINVPKYQGSAAERPLGLRCRPDLMIVPQDYGRERYWLVKDPVSLSYFHLRDEEHAILKMLDGQTGIAEIRARFETCFAPYQLPVEQIQAFLGRLHECGLVISSAPGQGEQLLDRARIRRKHRRWTAWTNVLAIRFRGIDPQLLLDWLGPRFRWCFSRAFLALIFILALIATVVVWLQVPKFSDVGVGARDFLHPGNLVWLVIVLAAVKVIHELGHGLACRQFGGQCRELGLMLLVFTPCLYCDVSDAWTFSDKWRRIAVSAAGIVVEVFLASVAALFWCWTRPGLIHSLLLNIMVGCSVSTLVFNGNPLLRLDGYYILADLLEVPNLAEQSWAVLVHTASYLCLGVRLTSDRVLPSKRRWLLGLYGLASVAYRGFIIVAILWIVHRVTKSFGLEVLGDAVATAVLAGIILTATWRFAEFLRGQSRNRYLQGGRAMVRCGLLAGALLFSFLYPWPSRVVAPVVIEPENAHRIYAVVPGTLTSSVRFGQQVQKDQELASLINLDIHKEVVELDGKRDQQRRQLAILRLQQAQDRAAAALIPMAEAALADLENRLRQRQRDEERLVLRAPLAGAVLPPARSAGSAKAPGMLDTWKGTPLDEKNRDCQVDAGTLICMVSPAQTVEAVAIVDQDAVALLRLGQRVRLCVDLLPGEMCEGCIEEIAKCDMKVMPRELAVGADLPVHIDPQGIAQPASISYQVRVRFDSQPRVSLAGSRGKAKVLVEPQSLLDRLVRALRQNFEFRW
jgi:putative peptide zinc metalloprotease protein